MYLFLSLLATLAYALQNTLNSYYYRNFNPIYVSALRGISLGITMFPLIFFADLCKIHIVKENLSTLIIASVFCGLGNAAAGNAYRYISVGLATAFQQGIFILGVCAVSGFMFGEKLVFAQMLSIVFLIFGIYLSSSRGKGLKLQFDRNTLLGLFYSSLFSVFNTIGFTNISKFSRQSDPFLAAYFWEFSIGIFGLIFCLGLNKFNINAETKISWRDFRGLLLASSPTIVGSGSFAVAATLGPISIISAILSGVIVFCSIFAYLFYSEKLSSKQVMGMIIVIISIVFINLFKSST